MRNKLIFLLVLFLIPYCVYAQKVNDVNYDITAAYIASDVDIVGSMHIKEAIIVDGSLNGFERVINYRNNELKSWTPNSEIDFSNSSIYNAKGMSLKKISSYKINESDIGFNVLSQVSDSFDEVSSASSGDSGIYTLSKTNDGMKIRVYNPNYSGYVVYYFEYYIDQAVVLHNDIAELY